MAAVKLPRPSTAFASVASVLMVGTVMAGMFAAKTKAERIESVKNFEIGHERLTGWKAVPHGPQTLFLYRDPQTKLLLRGAVNQVVSEFNPTPELKTEELAQFFIDRTVENQPDWKATKLESVEAKGTSFRMIRREKKDKCVVTAVAVRGNTTLLVSLSGNAKELKDIDRTMPAFKGFLAAVSMTEKDLSHL
jgi:hypothetical protein